MGVEWDGDRMLTSGSLLSCVALGRLSGAPSWQNSTSARVQVSGELASPGQPEAITSAPHLLPTPEVVQHTGKDCLFKKRPPSEG